MLIRLTSVWVQVVSPGQLHRTIAGSGVSLPESVGANSTLAVATRASNPEDQEDEPVCGESTMHTLRTRR